MFKTDLTDVTFIVPFSLDSADRLRNLKITTAFLLRHFETSVMISEYDSAPRLAAQAEGLMQQPGMKHQFHHNAGTWFQRTRSVNLAVQTITTPYFVIYDADVLLPTRQISQSVSWLRAGKADMCLPFANRVMWINQEGVEHLPPIVTDTILAELQADVSDDQHIFLGLVNCLNTRSFMEAGMMNEQFRAWGYEEMELYTRMIKLGYGVLRTAGLAYHLDHARGSSSSVHHPHYQHNLMEYHRILAANPDDLRRAIDTWSWVPKPEQRA